MKRFLIISAFLASMAVQAQSYFILSNGVTLTLDKAGYIYDFNHFFLPYKVEVNGGQFLISQTILHTVDDKGMLYKKDLEVSEVKGKGLNYFINDSYHLYTIDEKGFFFKYDKDKSIFKKSAGFGGNFFTVTMDEKKKLTDLYTINSKGNYFKVSLPGLNPYDISTFGGKWFVNNKNVVYTVSKDGSVFSKEEVVVGKVVSKGGNYLVDETKRIYTVTDEGYLLLPNLPLKFNLDQIVKFGSNFMIDKDGLVFVVDANGQVIERSVNGHDLRNAKILSSK
jgi:hypothetical protein